MHYSLYVLVNPVPDLLPERTAHLEIYVSADPQDERMEICNAVGKEGITRNTYLNCTQAMIGRYVTLKRKPSSHKSYRMNICEVDVYGYLYHGKLGSVQKKPVRCRTWYIPGELVQYHGGR